MAVNKLHKAIALVRAGDHFETILAGLQQVLNTLMQKPALARWRCHQLVDGRAICRSIRYDRHPHARRQDDRIEANHRCMERREVEVQPTIYAPPMIRRQRHNQSGHDSLRRQHELIIGVNRVEQFRANRSANTHRKLRRTAHRQLRPRRNDDGGRLGKSSCTDESDRQKCLAAYHVCKVDEG